VPQGGSVVNDSAAPVLATAESGLLSAHERACLADAVESSHRIYKRHQFFSWTQQGVVQALIPHEIMVWGVRDQGGMHMDTHRFTSTRYFAQSHFEAVCREGDGLLARVITTWRKSSAPLICVPGRSTFADAESMLAELEQHELRNLVGHGLWGAGDQVAGFYMFSRVNAEHVTRIAYVVELLLPTLHAAFLRVLQNERPAVSAMPKVRRSQAVTDREAEILRWIKAGKTNPDIARILKLSPWTVKNHMQNILKKLGADNRSHAVARAISLGIISSSE
jgi:transcriptional regulator EpsA